MSQSLEKVNMATAVAEVVHFGEKLILPENMSMDQAIDLIERRRKYLEEEIEFVDEFNVFPWDGAYALKKVLIKKFGWAPSEPIQTMFGKQPPKEISIEVGYNQTENVPWGLMSLPGFGGSTIRCGATDKDGLVIFAVRVNTVRKYEQDIRALLEELRHETRTNSIYRGKAIKIRFKDDSGDNIQLPHPQFIDTQNVNPDHVIYAKSVQDQINVNLYTPISRVQDCLDNDISVKRGILLGGTYGTGKTLAAKVASKLATDHGLTYLYVPRADELAQAIKFAQQYQSPACVIFCEDIDREMAGDRSAEMDDILNIIDGIDTKTSNIIVVMTSNDLSNINPAMLRPGRLDAVIEVTPPDAEAVVKLLHMYGAGTIDPHANLEAAAKVLEGTIPAVIAEVVKRAKLAQLSLQTPGTPVINISEQALIDAAHSMSSQLKLLKDRTDAPTAAPTVDSVLRDVIDTVNGPTVAMVRKIHDRVM